MDWNRTIFLAHANEDKPIVRKIYNDLKKENLNPWFDEYSLEPGKKWKDEIKNAIKKSRFFMACISKNSVKKNGYVQNELKLALQELERRPPDNLYFIPVLLDDIEIPNVTVGTICLRDYHAIKFSNTEGWKNLLLFLKKEVDLIQEEEATNPNKNRIKEFISKDKIEKAIDLLKYWGENSEYFNTILLLERRYLNLRKAFLSGTITDEFYRLEENRILIAVLEISDSL